jgi:glycosyltransferase involved in cell wall biosynthesis
MRALHVVSSIDPRAGGPVAALVGLTEALVAAGVGVSVVATRGQGDDVALAERLAKARIDVRLVGPVRGPLGTHPDLRAAVRDAVGRSDVVHVHALWEDVQHQAARAARAARVPYVVRPCGMLDPWSLRQSRWKKRLYLLWRLRRDLDRAAAVHFTTDVERDLTAPLRLRAPAIVEPNGIDLREFDPLPPPGWLSGRHPQIRGRRITLFLSRVHPKKGLDVLLPAFAQACTPDDVLVIAGPADGAYRQQLEAAADALGLGDAVVFAGMLHGSERVAALADAALFVLPSYQENFGIAVAEALAAGCPAVVSDQVNIHAEVTAAGAGATVPVAAGPLAAALREWLADPARRAAAASRGRALVRERYDWRSIAARWAEHYRRLAGPAAAAVPHPRAGGLA